MFDIALLNIIFILVTIICYILYSIYENVFGSKFNDLFFSFTILSSIYLITKHSMNINYSITIIKILFLICLIKEKKNIFIFIYSYIFYYFGNIYFIISTIEFIAIYIFKNIKYEYKIIIFYIIEILSEILIKSNYMWVIYINILYGIITYILINIINKTNNIISIYGTVRQIEYEKNFRESLFKITHEIKNPIAVCKGYLDMLDINNSKQVNKYIPIIKEEIDRTLILMNDFLNLNKLRVDKSIMDISLLLDDLINNIKPLLIELNIKFIYEIDCDEVYINGDYNRLKQVFINLIKNSIESISKDIDGIIKLKVNIKKDNIIIIIEDNGSGMNKDTINKIGEAFFTTKDKGTGLGVKLCTEIIEQHNGTIKYKSKVGKGTSVIITLPKYK